MVRRALVACILIACGASPPAVPDASVEIDAPGVDAIECLQDPQDAGSDHPGHRCDGGDLRDCDALIPPSCDAYGCCTACVQIGDDPNGCCCVDISLSPAVSPCCSGETVLDPDVCVRCTQGVPP